MGKLSHPSPLLIDLLRFLGLHLGLKHGQRRSLLPPYQRPPFLRSRTTLLLENTDLTIRSPRPIPMMPPSGMLPPRLINQPLARWTRVPVDTRIIPKRLRIELHTHPRWAIASIESWFV
jgi:hypothetical protein